MEAKPQRRITWPNGIDELDIRQKTVGQTIVVHGEYRRTTHRSEIATLVDGILNNTGGIAAAHWDADQVKSFDVFAGPGSRDAVATINKWIARGCEKSTKAAAWAKLPAFNHAEWYHDEVERNEQERLDLYLGDEPEVKEDEPVRVKITVEWPDELLRYEVTPRAIFGNELQALNDIRKGDHVWITQLPNHEIRISGFDIVNVEAAELRYKTLVQRVRTEKCSVQQPTNLVLDEREGIDTVLVRAEDWWPDRTNSVVPRLLPSPIMDEVGDYLTAGVDDIQLVQIRESIKRALEIASYKRGSFDFAVRLGCVALHMGQDHIGKKHGKEKLIKSINGRVELKPKRWLLNNVLGTQLRYRLVSARDFLSPIKCAGYWGTIPASLEETRPVLRGWWVFRDPNYTHKQQAPPVRSIGNPMPESQTSSAAGSNILSSLIVVQIDWTDDGEGSYDKTETRFYRLDPGTAGPKVNMDINLLELGESRAWSFALESMNLVSRSTVPPVLDGFAKRAAVKRGYSMTSTESFVEWDNGPSVKSLFCTGRAEKIYQFGVRDTCYKVELTAMWYPSQPLPCWGLAVRHLEWASHLAELERLQTGHRANWGDTVTTFLPDDGGSSTWPDQDTNLGVDGLSLKEATRNPQRSLSRDGIRTLVNVLLQLSKVVSSVTSGREGI